MCAYSHALRLHRLRFPLGVVSLSELHQDVSSVREKMQTTFYAVDRSPKGQISRGLPELMCFLSVY